MGDNHPHTLTSADNLSACLRLLGCYEQARQLSEDTLTRRRILGEDHLDTLILAAHLSAVLRELGQHEQARQLAEDTYTRYRQVLGAG